MCNDGLNRWTNRQRLLKILRTDGQSDNGEKETNERTIKRDVSEAILKCGDVAIKEQRSCCLHQYLAVLSYRFLQKRDVFFASFHNVQLELFWLREKEVNQSIYQNHQSP